MRSQLNSRLLASQGVTEDQVTKLESLYTMMDNIFNRCRKMSDNEIRVHQDIINDTIRDIEFHMQDNWNFKRDQTRHTWWYKNPKCRCPKTDNADMFGISERANNRLCPLHGSAGFQFLVISKCGNIQWDATVVVDKNSITWEAVSANAPMFSGRISALDNTVKNAVTQCKLSIVNWCKHEQ